MSLLEWVVGFFRRLAGRSDPNAEPPVESPPISAKAPESVYVHVNFLRELILEAEKWVGVHEVGGNNRGPEVERFQRAVDGRAEAEAWCAAFVQFCMKEVATRLAATQVAFPSEHCLTIWARTSKIHCAASPKSGYLVIWKYDGTSNGHIGIVSRVIDEFTIETIEGNTSPEDKTIVREGDGVYRKTRSTKRVGKMKLVGYVCPFNPIETERPTLSVS
ncbi:MAG: CHAP domain-containing protein [Dehalococcoidia bacterium]|nr:CHAP domain-containing protein [Dehalococcoidia bacterium]